MPGQGRSPGGAKASHAEQWASTDPATVQILHQSKHFVVINKPPHCVMDGDHVCTVEKLMKARLQPTPEKLFWVHQLDAETSGALCIALSHAAASAACKLFEQRHARKEYLSIVHGTLQLPDSAAQAAGAAARAKPTPAPSGPGIAKKRKRSGASSRKGRPGNPIPAFGFFERDRRFALAKRERLSKESGGAPASSEGGAVAGTRGAQPESPLTPWEQRLIDTKWKQIKRLTDDENDMVRPSSSVARAACARQPHPLPQPT